MEDNMPDLEQHEEVRAQENTAREIPQQQPQITDPAVLEMLRRSAEANGRTPD